MTVLMDWLQNINTFITVVDAGSFAQAAKQLHTSGSVISKRIAWLESMLDIQLMSRTTRRLDITEAGTRLYQNGKPWVEQWLAIKDEVVSTNSEPRGQLCLGLRSSGGQYLLPQVEQFLQLFPQIELEIKMTNHKIDLVSEQIDVFICADHNFVNLNNLCEVPLSHYTRQVFAAPDYLARHGTPNCPTDLTQHNCLTTSIGEYTNTWELNGELVTVNGNLRAEQVDLIIEAAVKGMGIIWTSALLVNHYVKQGKLVNILPNYKSTTVHSYAFYPKQRYLPYLTKVFLDYTTEFMNQLAPETTA